MSAVAKMSQASIRMSPIFIICKKFTILLVLLHTAVCCNNPLFESLFAVLKSAFSWPKVFQLILQPQLSHFSAHITISWNELRSKILHKPRVTPLKRRNHYKNLYYYKIVYRVWCSLSKFWAYRCAWFIHQKPCKSVRTSSTSFTPIWLALPQFYHLQRTAVDAIEAA